MSEEIEAVEPLDIDETDSPVAPVRDRNAIVLVFAGGVVGTLARYALSSAFPHLADLPLGVLVSNLSGAFLIGVLIESLALRGDDTGRRRRMRLLLGTGVLGGYTTYSALSVDSASLLEHGRLALSLGYGVVTVVVGGLATWAGIAAARAFGGAR